jgi:uncharacterized membrane protein
VAVAYPDPRTAEQAQATVFELEHQLFARVEQVAVISRDADGRFHVHTSHDGIPMAGGAIWGGFWGLLFGTLFVIPLAGWAIGAGVGARLGYLKEKGIGRRLPATGARPPATRALPRCSWSSNALTLPGRSKR